MARRDVFCVNVWCLVTSGEKPILFEEISDALFGKFPVGMLLFYKGM